MQVHPPTSSRVVLLECGGRAAATDLHSHASTWPAATASEGDGDLWACVAADGRLRVFDGAVASSRTLLHSTPVLGPVLALTLWPSRRVAITLEEATDTRARYSRIIRFYSWATRDREVLELAAVELDQPDFTPIFSPSLFSVCTHTRTLALAHDQEIRLYDLDDIFCDEDAPSMSHAQPDPSLMELEPGAEIKSANPSPAPAQSRIITATFPHTRRYLVKVYQVLPLVTVHSQFAVRHLDYKQSYLSYSSYNESRLLHLRLEQRPAGRRNTDERTIDSTPRIRTMPVAASAHHTGNAHSPLVSVPRLSSPSHHASRSSSGHHRKVSSSSSPSPRLAPTVPFEHIGTRVVDVDLRMVLREDMRVGEVMVVLHRRFSPTEQIHTAKLVPTLHSHDQRDKHAAQRDNKRRKATGGDSTPPQSTMHSRTSSFATMPTAATLRQPISPPLTASAVGCTSPPSVKEDLFRLLGQGLPTQPFSVPLIPESSGSSPVHSSFVSTSSFEHGGVVVELMDDDEDAHAARQRMQEVLTKLEELNDHESSSPSPSSSSDRSNGLVDLPMRLLLSTSEECHLYDVESDVKLVTYYFDHDLVSLHVRSTFLLALTTHGLEVHSLWFSHPMLHFLTLPMLIQREEPVLARDGAVQEKIQDILVLDGHILMRPMPSYRSQADGMYAGSPPQQLIVPTDEVDPCESWSSVPIKAMPTVCDAVAHTIQPLALKSMQSSKEATPSSIRLFTEALLLLMQRYSQLRVILDRTSNDALDSPRREFATVASSLSAINSYLANLFLTSHEVGLSSYFFYYQQSSSLTEMWRRISEEVHSPSATSQQTHMTKLLIKVLLHPTAAEQSLLLHSHELVASFVSHLGLHAPHVLGTVLLKTFLLHCPYDPRQVLKILEENAARANYDAAASAGQSYRASRSDSTVGTPTSATAAGAGHTPYRVRPVVFHTFVQALMHLQLCSVASAAASAGKDSASILLNSFSAHSLEYLLATHSALLTRWTHRHLLVDFLRASVPWSLIEVLVLLTQRGEVDVHVGVTLLIGAQAAASVLAPTSVGAASAFSSVSFSLTQLQAYLECALNPFMLSHEIGAVLEHDHGHSIEPFDTRADADAYLVAATNEQSVHGGDVPDPNAKFVPLHIRANHLHNPHQMVVASQAPDAPSITRGQVAALASQLACFYLQVELLESSCASPSSRPVSVQSAPTPRRAMSMTMSLAPAAEFSSRHALARWWRATWIEAMRGQTVDAPGEPTRMRRLQALLSAPMPLARKQCEQICALAQQLPNDEPNAPPVKATLMMLVLPRVGRLSAALRLVVGHSPECMWPFAQIYCGGDLASPNPASARATLLHWQLLHAILLMSIFHTAHSAALLQQHAPSLARLPADHTDESAARTMLQSLLPSHLIDPLLRALPLDVVSSACSFATSPVDMTSIDRAALFQQLYAFLLAQLVERHDPPDFITFLPQAGSARFYLPYVQQNMDAYQRRQVKPVDEHARSRRLNI